MKHFLPILILMTIASIAWGAYPGPDNIGVYADDEATGEIVAGAMQGAFTTRTYYLCLTQPSADQVAAWEGNVEIVSDSMHFGSWQIPQDGINLGTGLNYIVGHGASPLLPNAQNAITLMTIDLTIIDAVNPVSFYVRRCEGSISFDMTAGYAPYAGVMIPMYNSTGGPGIPVFVINGQAPVANEILAWGSVKRLYD